MNYLREHGHTIGLIGSAGFVTAWGMEQSLAFAVTAGIGASISGAIVARLFGAEGLTGWMLATCGAVLATLMGAGSVGWMMTGARGADIAISAVSAALWEDPMTTLRWLVLMAVAQLVAVGEARRDINPVS